MLIPNVLPCSERGHSNVNRTSYYYLADHDGNILVDFVGRYERLQDDLRTACELAGLPVPPKLTRGHRSAHGPYQDYYDEETRELLTPFVKRDAELLDYHFTDELSP